MEEAAILSSVSEQVVILSRSLIGCSAEETTQLAPRESVKKSPECQDLRMHTILTIILATATTSLNWLAYYRQHVSFRFLLCFMVWGSTRGNKDWILIVFWWEKKAWGRPPADLPIQYLLPRCRANSCLLYLGQYIRFAASLEGLAIMSPKGNASSL